jgi:hypothetical protein
LKVSLANVEIYLLAIVRAGEADKLGAEAGNGRDNER